MVRGSTLECAVTCGRARRSGSLLAWSFCNVSTSAAEDDEQALGYEFGDGAPGRHAGYSVPRCQVGLGWQLGARREFACLDIAADVIGDLRPYVHEPGRVDAITAVLVPRHADRLTAPLTCTN